LDQALAAGATVVAVAFALATWDRWLRRRRPHELAWTVSLLLFAVGSGALWWAEARGWSQDSFRLFYLAGAILNVPWLAVGTVYLLAGPAWGDRTRTWLIGLSGLATGVVLAAPLHAGEITPHDLPEGKAVFGAWPRVLAGVGSGVAALVIIAGALWSAARVWRGKSPTLTGESRRVAMPRRLAVGNVVIATGTLVLSASGTFAGRLGKDRAFAITLLVGVTVLFAGFLIASTSSSPRRPARVAPSAQVATQDLAPEPLR
jgi:hypothetical protein